MGLEALKLLREAGDKYDLLVTTEVMEISQIEVMLPYIDVFQVGARNMQNFNLLRELGQVRKPVLLKRGIAATIEELLLSAEYILAGGNYDVILCERGIRTFETSRATPWTSPPSRWCRSFRTCRSSPILARHRTPRQGGADGARRGRGRRRRADHRGPSRSRQGFVRRRAVAVPRSVAKLMEDLRIIAPAVGQDHPLTMAIERIAILGTGLLGTSVGLALRESGFKGSITGWDRDPKQLQIALERGAVSNPR